MQAQKNTSLWSLQHLTHTHARIHTNTHVSIVFGKTSLQSLHPHVFQVQAPHLRIYTSQIYNHRLIRKHSLWESTPSKPTSTCFADASPIRKRITHVKSHTFTQTQKYAFEAYAHVLSSHPPTHITNILSQTHQQTHRRCVWSLQMLARILIMHTHIILNAYMHRAPWHLHIRNTTAFGGPHVLCSHLIYAPTTSHIYNPGPKQPANTKNMPWKPALGCLADDSERHPWCVHTFTHKQSQMYTQTQLWKCVLKPSLQMSCPSKHTCNLMITNVHANTDKTCPQSASQTAHPCAHAFAHAITNVHARIENKPCLVCCCAYTLDKLSVKKQAYPGSQTHTLDKIVLSLCIKKSCTCLEWTRAEHTLMLCISHTFVCRNACKPSKPQTKNHSSIETDLKPNHQRRHSAVSKNMTFTSAGTVSGMLLQCYDVTT